MFAKQHAKTTATIVLKEEEHTIIFPELERHNK